MATKKKKFNGTEVVVTAPRMTAWEEAQSRGNLDPNNPEDAQILADDIMDTASVGSLFGGALDIGRAAAKGIRAVGQRVIPAVKVATRAARQAEGGVGARVSAGVDAAKRSQVRNQVFDTPVGSDTHFGRFRIGRVPEEGQAATHAYRSMSTPEMKEAKRLGYLLGPKRGVSKYTNSDRVKSNGREFSDDLAKWFSEGDAEGYFGRPWKGGANTRIPLEDVPNFLKRGEIGPANMARAERLGENGWEPFKKGGKVKAAGYAKGGMVKSRDGIAKRGKTKGRMR
jgi:hypothetical protein